jgi:hypothetical protein
MATGRANSKDRAAPGRPPDTRYDVDPDVAQLLGLRPPDAPSAAEPTELDDLGEMTDTRIYEGELEARTPGSDQPDRTLDESLESLTSTEARAGETDDPEEAAEEGLAWIPPTDPPVVAGPDGEPEIAAGFGTAADDEPFDADHHADALYPVDERTERVLEALRADAATAGLIDQLMVETDGGRAIVRGVVDDVDDEDAVIGVVSEVPGVAEVISEMEIRTFDTGLDPR